MYDEERPYEVFADTVDPKLRRSIWDTAAGLQRVDGLTVSDSAQKLGNRYVNGEYGPETLISTIESHYESRPSRQAEADIVAARITGVLDAAETMPLRMEPGTLKLIHRMLFKGQLENEEWVGRWRTENISKSEPTLGGRSVKYADWRMIDDLLQYDFNEESDYVYDDIKSSANIDHLAVFIARVWETHPFREGNTRTIATFSQLILSQHGIAPGNDVFKEKSTWFRDALVRASYSSIAEDIKSDDTFIKAFFENLVGAAHDLDSFDLNLHGIRVNDTPYRSTGKIDLDAEHPRPSGRPKPPLPCSKKPNLQQDVRDANSQSTTRSKTKSGVSHPANHRKRDIRS